MKTLSFTVSAKKGDTQIVRWLVVQNIPYPRINANGGPLCWENDDRQLWDRYQQPAKGIGQNYTCYLLADTCPDPVPADYNRTHFAGYVPCRGYKDPDPKPNGGSVVFRGKTLGECTVKIDSTGYVMINVGDGFTRPGNAESDFFKDQIVPTIKQFIADNREELRNYALAKLKTNLASEVSEKRKELDKLESQIAEAKF